MKHFIIFLLLALTTLSLHAQSSGGVVRRKTATTKTNAKPQNNIGKKRNTTASASASKKRTKRSTSRRRPSTYNYNNRQSYEEEYLDSVTDDSYEYYASESDTATQHAAREICELMVYVEGGTFTMGATTNQKGGDDEYPRHQVTVSDFLISAVPVTQEQWEAIMGNNPSKFVGPIRPVTDVSWNDCQEFIHRLNLLVDLPNDLLFRLPTEAEWEFAARGGNKTHNYRYAGTDKKLDDYAWYGDHSDNNTHDVADKLPNELGLFDMSGNILEWCQDYYGPYSDDADVDPQGPSSGTERVLRGGCSWSPKENCRVSYRSKGLPTESYCRQGFRIAI